MKNVTFLIFPNIMASSISLPLEMLNAADGIWRSQSKNNKSVKIQFAAQTLDPVSTSGGLKITPDTLINNIDHTDLLIIPGLWRNPINTLKKNIAVCEWLKTIVTPETKICAVGTGSTFLAESNILDNKAATTHWFYFDLMEKIYPKVKWKRQHLITQSGNIFCAGSVNSIADLAIHFIEQGYSAAIARKVESQFSPEIRRAYDSHLFDESPHTRHQDEVVAEIQDFIQRNYHDEINFTEQAAKAGISSRTLQRRFRSANGYSPLQYQQYIRVNNAKELLQNTNLNIQDIAELIGYVDASHLSQVFKNHTQQTPSAFRKAVRGKLFSSRN